MHGSPIARAIAGLMALAAVAACTPYASTPDPSVVTLTPTFVPVPPDPTPSASPVASATPSPTPSASPEPTIQGPIVPAPKGAPVSPEVDLATVDDDEGVLVVRASVPGIVEDTGTCTVTVTVSATTVKKTSTGAGNLTSTECGQFLFKLSGLPSGRAFITVSYTSPDHTGKSKPTEVSLP